MSPSYDRSRFVRRPWWAPTTTLLWVVFITVLIWIYADMEFTKTGQLTVTIQLESRRKEDVALLSEKTHRVTFELQGSRRDLDEFIAKHENRTLTFDISGMLDVGVNQRLQTATVLEQSLGVDELGFVIQSGSPAAITGIHLDRMVARELPVEFDFEGAELVETPTVRVRAWAAQSRWDEIDRLLAKAKAPAVVRTERRDFKGEPRGVPIRVTWELSPFVAGIEIRPESPKITHTVQIRERTDRKTLRVAVRVTAPYTWLEDGTWDSYVFTRETEETAWVKEVEVTGAKEDLDQLLGEQVDAYIVLAEGDKKTVASWLERQVEFRLPAKLNVKLAGGPYLVKFKLEPRKVGPTGPVP